MQALLIQALSIFFNLLEKLIFVRIILSWLPIGFNNPITQLLYNLTEPILGPVREMVDRSPIGGGMGLDFSPIFVLILLRLLQMLLMAAVSMV
mgnify:CR=1 FL=1